MDCQSIINSVYAQVKDIDNEGRIATYIPALGNIDPEKLGVCLSSIDGHQFSAGDCKEQFSIQSIAKVFALSIAYQILGDSMWNRLGVEPSGTAFNSLIQLELEAGIPRNPFINAGAIVVCDILCSQLQNPLQEVIEFVRKAAENATIQYDETIALSEKQTGFKNYALINLMKSFGNIHNDIEEVLDIYFHLSSIKMSCEELSHAFLYLANDGLLLKHRQQLIHPVQVNRINAIMLTCGFYDEAGEFAFRVGLPGKSGVGGGIAAILPDQYAIAVWSPRLNPKGNSFRGLKFLELFTSQTKNTIF